VNKRSNLNFKPSASSRDLKPMHSVTKNLVLFLENFQELTQNSLLLLHELRVC